MYHLFWFYLSASSLYLSQTYWELNNQIKIWRKPLISASVGLEYSGLKVSKRLAGLMIYPGLDRQQMKEAPWVSTHIRQNKISVHGT